MSTSSTDKLNRSSFEKIASIYGGILIAAGPDAGKTTLADALRLHAQDPVSYTHLRAHRDRQKSRMPSSA